MELWKRKHVWRGLRSSRRYVARVTPSRRDKATCGKCGAHVRRSWRTGITWSHCFTCRYLMMIYGPTIEVTRVE